MLTLLEALRSWWWSLRRWAFWRREALRKVLRGRRGRPRRVLLELDVRGLEEASAEARRLADHLDDAREAWDACPSEIRRRIARLEGRGQGG